ncbi:ABC transporter [Beggiatoa sp. PS]|nr:ABC transporter [Beggiatoa sp. PS]
MYFELKNIGAIKKAKIELGKLTVVCGKNNTGKTYITYSIYGFLYEKFELLTKAWAYIHELENLSHEEKLNSFNKQLSKLYSQQLCNIFNVNPDEFAHSEFQIYLDNINTDNSQKFLDFFLKYLLEDRSSPFIASAERTGIQLFQKELDKHKNELIKKLTKTRDFNLLEESLARFALPIERNITFARDYDNVIKSNSFLKQDYPELVTYIEDMLRVKYEIIDGHKVVRDKTTNKALPYYMASTSVRALFDLHLWLKHFAEKGDILFIDEPELNLHPENQIKITRLLVNLVNAGLKVFITTHSDYIIKELNNLLMFANEFPEKSKLMEQHGYTPNDVLQTQDLKAYITHIEGTVSEVETDEYGMIQSGFDEAIVQIDETSNQIISAIDNLLES